jgi:phosphoglycerate dehydrogenase-like enzyme
VVEARSIARSQEHLRRTGWNVGGDLPYFHFRGPELGGKTLGIIGFGAVGAEVARRAVEGFGMRAVVYDPYAEIPPPYRTVALSELLEQSDVVSLHCPPTKETIGMIGSRELERMKPSAYLVNTARAQIVDEQGLVDALERRVIAGAALDVYWEEPLPRDHPLLGLDNVTITPHIAGAADDVREHQAAMVLEDIARWQAGERPLRLANPAVWESSEVKLT